MHLLHPIMPFLTEEIASKRNLLDGQLVTASWPAAEPHLAAPEAESEIDWAIRFVSQIRAVRAECNVPPGARIEAFVQGASEETSERFSRNEEPIKRLARLTNVVFGEAAPAGAVQLVVDEATIALPIGDVIDLKEETGRLTKEIEKISKEADDMKKRLANSNFTSKAPPEVVEENRERLASVELQRNKLEMALKRLAEA